MVVSGCAGVTIVALAAVLWAETQERAALGWIAKPIASAGFIGVALASGALGSGVGRIGLVALLLCWCGDVLLLGTSRRPFLAGLLAFAAGHVAYCVAFAVGGVDPAWVFGGLAAVGIAAVPVLRWLWPSVPGPMRPFVAGYVVVISAMVALGLGTGSGWITLGAVLFYLSDLCVARQRFVQRAVLNRWIGLPLYYGGQLVLASALAAWGAS